MPTLRHVALVILLVGGVQLFIGCAIHPLPDDISRETTYSIVQKVRCEARAEVKAQVARMLTHSAVPAVQAMDAEHVLDKLEAIRRDDPALAGIIDKYKASVIGYAFTFKIKATNDEGGSAQLKLPFSHGELKLGLGGQVKRDRESDRKIDVIETFAELHALQCGDVSAPHDNLLYPITGSIGMGEMMRSFLYLSESMKLDMADKKFVDTLIFTTRIASVGVQPSIVLKRFPTDRFRLASASAKIAYEREDMHQVIVTLTFPVEARQEMRMSAGPAALQRASGRVGGNVYTETKQKVAEELCIQRVLAREEATGITRVEPPELYCRGGAAAE
jgi:hypothetical protein